MFSVDFMITLMHTNMELKKLHKEIISIYEKNKDSLKYNKEINKAYIDIKNNKYLRIDEVKHIRFIIQVELE